MLPAPFGGHKRSILCQFFGQIPLVGGSKKSIKANKPDRNKIQLPLPQYPPISYPNYEPESVSILQQAQQPPIAFVSSGRHPIQIVLDQHFSASRPTNPGRTLSQPESVQDLKSSDSVVDIAYHQKVEPPPGFVAKVYATKKPSVDLSKSKFSSPVSVNSFKPVSVQNVTSQQMSTSGWRIFNQTFDLNETSSLSASLPTSTVSPAKTSSGELTLALRHTPARTNSTLATSNPKKYEPTVVSPTPEDLTSSTKPSTYLSASSTASASSKSTVSSTETPNLAAQAVGLAVRATSDKENDSNSSGIRTIEVVAQSSAEPPYKKFHLYPMLNERGGNLTPTLISTTTTTTTTTQKPQTNSTGQETSRQTQKREELVIASINNLTRIAFGNQLRDTVKVINRLIEQQSNVFQPSKGSIVALDGKKSDVGVGSKSSLKSGDNKTTTSRQIKSIRPSTSTVSNRSLQPNTTSASLQLPKASEKKSTTKKVSRQVKTTPTAKTTSNPITKLSHRPSTRAPNRGSTLDGRTSRKSSRLLGPAEVRRVTSADMINPISSRWKSRMPPDDLDTLSATMVGDIRRDKQPWILDNAGQLNKFPQIAARATSSLGSGKQQHEYPWLQVGEKVASISQVDNTKSFGGTKGSFEGWTSNRVSSTPLWLTSQRDLSKIRDSKIYSSRSDSLTTLKLSLTTSQPLETSIASERADFKSMVDGTTQSRWIAKMTAKPDITIASESSKGLTGDTSTPISTTASVMKTSPSQSDLNEIRASESISKYTTHLNDINELLATTRRSQPQTLTTQPQLASTGEYFSAETISNWPERYQTLMSSKETTVDDNSIKQTTPQLETTRRNGESYAMATDAIHQDNIKTSETTMTTQSQSTKTNAPSTTSVTILPSNHKLSTSPVEAYPSTSTHNNWPTTTVPDMKLPASVGYTLVGPYMPSQTEVTEPEGQVSTMTLTPNEKFPQIFGDASKGLNQKQDIGMVDTSVNMSHVLRPPYSETHQVDETSEDALSLENLDDEQAELSKPHIARKLYDLLVPSTRNFVGFQSPINQQRFNLSALKFLVQNLLSPSKDQNISNETKIGDSSTSDDSAQEKLQLLDLLSETPQTPGYYDIMADNNRTIDLRPAKNSTNSLPSRAANLLRDLRKLEQKKAAAILAAIRYQVPSPLVRPWDLASDLQRSVNLGQSAAFMDKRFDSAKSAGLKNNNMSNQPEQLNETFQMALLGRAIRAALFRQRVVPRNELEARLNPGGFQMFTNYSERRSDGNIEDRSDSDGLELSQLEYDSSDLGRSHVSRNSSAKSWLEQLVSKANSMITADTKSKYSILNDYDSVNLNRNTSINDTSKSEIHNENDPKYIRFADYQTAWSQQSQENYPWTKSPFHSKSSNHRPEFESGLKRAVDGDSTMNPRDQAASGKKPENDATRIIGKFNEDSVYSSSDSKINFDCSTRLAGFYPDRGTACQVRSISPH